jgi:hypothetical protein
MCVCEVPSSYLQLLAGEEFYPDWVFWSSCDDFFLKLLISEQGGDCSYMGYLLLFIFLIDT